MKNFLLSKNNNYEFVLFGFQHILMLFFTLFLFICLYICVRKKYIKWFNYNKVSVIMILIILLNMLIYRGSYIYYGVYNIKVHLSLYYCHIVNYLFVISLILKNKNLQKIVYLLSWIGSIWTVIFPDVSGGIDCFIFYSSFISHNLLLVFVSIILCINNIKIKLKDITKAFLICLFIFFVSHVINYDFGTDYNSPYSILKDYVNVAIYIRYLMLIIMGIIGCIIGYIISKILRSE